MSSKPKLSTAPSKPDCWLRQDGFHEWPEQEDKEEEDPVAKLLSQSDYQVVVRLRSPSSTWEHFCSKVVGSPVHVDTVLAQRGTDGSKVCFSSYMNEKFKMYIMDKALLYDPNLSNLALDITEEEHARCAKFVNALDGRASYSYMDAMVLMPMAPKPYASSDIMTKAQRMYSDVFNTLVADNDEEIANPLDIKKVFCSQSVVLMLRYGLDPHGKHAKLVETLHQINSRLVSPKQVHQILDAYGAMSISNQQLAAL